MQKVAKSAMGTIGHEIGHSIGKSVGGSFGKRIKPGIIKYFI